MRSPKLPMPPVPGSYVGTVLSGRTFSGQPNIQGIGRSPMSAAHERVKMVLAANTRFANYSVTRLLEEKQSILVLLYDTEALESWSFGVARQVAAQIREELPRNVWAEVGVMAGGKALAAESVLALATSVEEFAAWIQEHGERLTP